MKKSLKLGTYSAAVTAIIIAIVVALNLLVMALPSNLTQYDISSAKLYSITSNTKVVLSGLDKDVTIYWICQSGEEDSIVTKLLSKYEAESSHIEVVRKNPDIYPTFAEQYTDGTVYNNDLVIECGSKYRYISIEDIYEYDYTSYYSYDAYFDGEGEITSAIDYVVSDDLPQLYVLTGHGEADFATSVSSAIEKENIEITEFSLLTQSNIPEDADCVLINAPSTDISDVELEILKSYVQEGGKLIVISGLVEGESLTNLDSLAAYYGINKNNGVVIEGDSNCYAYGYPYILLPELNSSSEITSAQVQDNDYVVMAITTGYTLDENTAYANGVELTSLLDTSDSAYCKTAGYSISTYDKEENDIAGPFSLAVSIVDDSYGNDGKALFIASDYLLDETYVSYSSEANLDFVLNSLAWMTGETDTISIRSKSLNYETLSISDAQASRIKFVMLLMVPACFIVMGIVEVISRKKRLK